jgi:hypothetical protein
MFAVLSERVCTAELSNFAEGASKSPRPKRELVTIPIFGSPFFPVGHQYREAVYDAPQEIAAPTSSRISARCFQNDEGLFALLHVARIVFESQMANDATAYNTEDFHARLRGSATSR